MSTIDFEQIKNKALVKDFEGECYRLYRNILDDGLVNLGNAPFKQIHSFIHSNKYHVTESQFWFIIRICLWRFSGETYLNDIKNSLTKENKKEYAILESECPKSLDYFWFGEVGVSNLVRKDKTNNDNRVEVKLVGKKKLFAPERVR